MKKQSITLAIAAVLFSSGALATQFALVGNTQAEKAESKADKLPELHIVSNRHINRIVTPFNVPSIALDDVSGVTSKPKGNVLYLSTTNDNPIAAFITEKDDESSAIRVVLKPMPVGPQEVVLMGMNNGSNAIAKRFEQASSRTEMIIQAMTGIATGNLPLGYRVESVNPDYMPYCAQIGFSFDFANGQFISGGDYVVSVGVASNTSDKAMNLRENFCYQDGVVAVSFYPNPTLNANEKAEVLVMYHRDKKVHSQSGESRKSLLGGGQ